MADRFTGPKSLKNTLLKMSAMVCAVVEELALAIKYPENISTHNNSLVFPLKYHGSDGM